MSLKEQKLFKGGWRERWREEKASSMQGQYLGFLTAKSCQGSWLQTLSGAQCVAANECFQWGAVKGCVTHPTAMQAPCWVVGLGWGCPPHTPRLAPVPGCQHESCSQVLWDATGHVLSRAMDGSLHASSLRSVRREARTLWSVLQTSGNVLALVTSMVQSHMCKHKG